MFYRNCLMWSNLPKRTSCRWNASPRHLGRRVTRLRSTVALPRTPKILPYSFPCQKHACLLRQYIHRTYPYGGERAREPASADKAPATPPPPSGNSHHVVLASTSCLGRHETGHLPKKRGRRRVVQSANLCKKRCSQYQ